MSYCLVICPEVSFQTVHKGLLGNPEDVSVAMVTGRGETSSIFELKTNQSPSRLLLLLQHKETFKCSSQKLFISDQPSISHLYCLSNLVLFHVWSQFGVEKSTTDYFTITEEVGLFESSNGDWNPHFFLDDWPTCQCHSSPMVHLALLCPAGWGDVTSRDCVTWPSCHKITK